MPGIQHWTLRVLYVLFESYLIFCIVKCKYFQLSAPFLSVLDENKKGFEREYFF